MTDADIETVRKALEFAYHYCGDVPLDYEAAPSDYFGEAKDAFDRLETRLRDAEARCLPVLPEGWYLQGLGGGFGKFDCALQFGNYQYNKKVFGCGTTPREAVAAAIAKIGDENE